MIDKVKLPDPARHISLYRVTYGSDGMPVKGYLAVPEGFVPAPGLIYCRGGIGRVGMVRLPRIIAIAQKGYTVFAPFYRGAPGDPGRDEFGGADRRDVYNAVKLMRSLPEVEPLPVSLIGFSRGAIMALLAAKECDGAGPVVIWGGVSDLRLTYEERIDLRRMLKRVVGHPVKQAEAYRERSAVDWADAIRTPVMLVHGTADRHVTAEHARRLAAALEAAGKDYAATFFDGLEHAFPAQEERQAIDAIHEWLQRKLRL